MQENERVMPDPHEIGEFFEKFTRPTPTWREDPVVVILAACGLSMFIGGLLASLLRQGLL